MYIFVKDQHIVICKRNACKTYAKAYDMGMTTVTSTKARATLYHLIMNLQKDGEPVLITGKNGNAILISEDDWRSVEETLYLLSIPGMRDSIRRGMREPVSKGSTKIDL